MSIAHIAQARADSTTHVRIIPELGGSDGLQLAGRRSRNAYPPGLQKLLRPVQTLGRQLIVTK